MPRSLILQKLETSVVGMESNVTGSSTSSMSDHGSAPTAAACLLQRHALHRHKQGSLFFSRPPDAIHALASQGRCAKGR